MVNEYSKYDLAQRRYHANSEFISVFPRIFVEGFSTIALVVVSSFLYHENGTYSLALVGILAYSLQKIAPAFQQTYSCYIYYNNHRSSLAELFTYLISSKRGTPSIPPNHASASPLCSIQDLSNRFNESKIVVNDVSFRYNNNAPFVLRNINITLRPGDSIAINGHSGCGKTTLIEIICGLIDPTKGAVAFFDGDIYHPISSVRTMVGYVSQYPFFPNISLFDAVSNYSERNSSNLDKFHKAIELACLQDYLSSINDNHNYLIGERGSRLSGGLKQRLALARLFYSDKNLVILDEATSALDNTTRIRLEKNIHLFSKRKILIKVTHHKDAADMCDRVFEIPIVRNPPSFK